jgi:hypothetical protein
MFWRNDFFINLLKELITETVKELALVRIIDFLYIKKLYFFSVHKIIYVHVVFIRDVNETYQLKNLDSLYQGQ